MNKEDIKEWRNYIRTGLTISFTISAILYAIFQFIVERGQADWPFWSIVLLFSFLASFLFLLVSVLDFVSLKYKISFIPKDSLEIMAIISFLLLILIITSMVVSAKDLVSLVYSHT